MKKYPLTNIKKFFYEIYFNSAWLSSRTHHKTGVSIYETFRHFNKDYNDSRKLDGTYPNGHTAHYLTRGVHGSLELGNFAIEGIELVWEGNQFDMEYNVFSLPFKIHGIFKLDDPNSEWKHEIHRNSYPVLARENEEYLYCNGDCTFHAYRKNENMEGISINWDDDPFGMKFNDHKIEYYREF